MKPHPPVPLPLLLSKLKEVGDGGTGMGVFQPTERRGTDYDKILGFPPLSELQQGVHNAMLLLMKLKNDTIGRAELTQPEQGAATVAMVGILATNGYLGRKKEWETMDKNHVIQQLESGKDFVVCPNHKTSSVYGDLAKWLAPGIGVTIPPAQTPVLAIELAARTRTFWSCSLFLSPSLSVPLSLSLSISISPQHSLSHSVHLYTHVVAWSPPQAQ